MLFDFYYHGGCPDGSTAAFIVQQYSKLKNEVNYVPLYHGVATRIVVAAKDAIFIDYHPGNETLSSALEAYENVYLLDHHKSAFERRWPEGVHALLDDRVAGCELAYPNVDVQHSEHVVTSQGYKHPFDAYVTLPDMKKLHKMAPFVKLMSAGDRFDRKSGLDFVSFRAWFKQFEPTIEGVKDAYAAFTRLGEKEVLKQGKVFNELIMQVAAQSAKSAVIITVVEEAAGKAYEVPLCIATNLISETAVVLGNEYKEAPFVLVATPKKDFVSMGAYVSNGNFDVSALASSLGGGGHRSAAGWQCTFSDLMKMLEKPVAKK